LIIVLDASAALEVVLRRNSAENISATLVEADWVVSPNLYVSEVTNAFWKYQKLADYPYDECERNIEQAMALPDEFMPESDLYREAFNMGCLLGHPVYDMMYLVLARRHSAILATMDKKLGVMAKKAGVRTMPFE